MRPRIVIVAVLVGCGGDGDPMMMPVTGIAGESSTTNDATSSTSEAGESEGESESESGSPPEVVSCAYACSAPADCLAGGMGYGHTCQSGKCVIPCTTDDGCVAYFSGWTIEACTASADCQLGTCVVYENGTGGCAFTPDVAACADLGLQEVQRMTTEGTMVTVCTEPAATCVDLGAGTECIVPCTDFVDCYMRESGELCTDGGECVYACIEAGDCPAAIFDGVTPSCG
jgi:hypothetical protein